ncbi:hypothetical protein FACS1894122_10130 [Alphaproteobacteria bacterium]|nr:hypothetical protein FACS1894122_10130 [Alphaproteobacteria bacterium]
MNFGRKMKFWLPLFCFYACNASLYFDDFTNADNEFDIWLGMNVEGYALSSAPRDSLLKIPLYCCPFWGLTMIETKYLENLRLKGNVVPTTDPRNDRTLDTPQDRLENLIFTLFPSKLNTLGIVPMADGGDKPKMLALLLIKAEIFRVFEKNKISTPASVNNLIGEHSINGNAKKTLNDCLQRLRKKNETLKFAEAILRMVEPEARQPQGSGVRIKNIKKDNKYIQDEEIEKLLLEAIQDEASCGYAEHTVEHVIMAFAKCILNSKAEAQKFLKLYSEYREMMFTREYITNSSSIPAGTSKEKIASMTKKINEALNQHGLPYSPAPNNGSSYKYRMNDECHIEQIGTVPFADCVETSIRNIFNYVLGKKKIDELKSALNASHSETIKFSSMEVADFKYPKLPKNRLSQLSVFYRGSSVIREEVVGKEKTTIKEKRVNTSVNGEDYNSRSVWNHVVFGLNSNGDNKVVYAPREGNKDIKTQNELNAGFINVLRVMCAVIGIDPNKFLEKIYSKDLKKEEDLKEILKLIRSKFNELFEIINPDQIYSIYWKNHHVIEGDISGNIVVNVANKSEKDKEAIANKSADSKKAVDFNFTIFQKENAHGQVTPDTPKEEKACMRELIESTSDVEKQQVGYLFPHNDLQNDYHSIFSYADRNITYAALKNSIQSFQKYVEKTDNDPEFGKRKALRQILGNIIKDIPFSDEYISKQVRNVILSSVSDNNGYKEVVEIAKASPDGEVLDELINAPESSWVQGQQKRLPDLLADFKWMDDVRLDQENVLFLLKFSNLEFVDFSQLNCNLDSSQLPSSLKGLQIRKTSGNMNLSLSACARLKEAKLEGNFQSVELPNSLERLDVQKATIESPLDWSHFTHLKRLSAKYCDTLTSIFTDFLEELSINSEHKACNLNLLHCEKLRNLHLRGRYTSVHFPTNSLVVFDACNATISKSPDLSGILAAKIIQELRLPKSTYGNLILPKSLKIFECAKNVTITGRLDLSETEVSDLSLREGKYSHVVLPKSLEIFDCFYEERGTAEIEKLENLPEVLAAGKIKTLILPSKYTCDNLTLPESLETFQVNTFDITINGKLDLSDTKVTNMMLYGGTYNDILLPPSFKYFKCLANPEPKIKGTLDLSRTTINDLNSLYARASYNNVILPPSLEIFNCNVTIKGTLTLLSKSKTLKLLAGTFNDIVWPREIEALTLDYPVFNKDLKLPATLKSFKAENATIKGKLDFSAVTELKECVVPYDYDIDNKIILPLSGNFSKDRVTRGVPPAAATSSGWGFGGWGDVDEDD